MRLKAFGVTGLVLGAWTVIAATLPFGGFLR